MIRTILNPERMFAYGGGGKGSTSGGSGDNRPPTEYGQVSQNNRGPDRSQARGSEENRPPTEYGQTSQNNRAPAPRPSGVEESNAGRYSTALGQRREPVNIDRSSALYNSRAEQQARAGYGYQPISSPSRGLSTTRSYRENFAANLHEEVNSYQQQISEAGDRFFGDLGNRIESFLGSVGAVPLTETEPGIYARPDGSTVQLDRTWDRLPGEQTENPDRDRQDSQQQTTYAAPAPSADGGPGYNSTNDPISVPSVDYLLPSFPGIDRPTSSYLGNPGADFGQDLTTPETLGGGRQYLTDYLKRFIEQTGAQPPQSIF